MISSDLNVPTPAMLIPALAVPYAAPIANVSFFFVVYKYMRISSKDHQFILLKMGDVTAAATPPNPTNGADIIS